MLHALVISMCTLVAAAPNPEILNEQVNVYRGLEYVRYGDDALKLDLYLPSQAEEPVPGIVVIPGGGFRAQNEQKFSKEAQRLAAAGFAAASISYRGLPDNGFPTTVHDTKAAVRFMRANAEQYNIYPGAIGAFGQSAGGHLAGLLGTSGDVDALEGTVGNVGVSSRVQAVVSFAGVFDFVARFRKGGHQKKDLEERRDRLGTWLNEPLSEGSAVWKLGSPISHVSKDDPPMLLVHCKDDTTVPYYQSLEMYDSIKTINPDNRLLLFDKGGHGIRGSDIIGDEAWQWTIEFFQEYLSSRIEKDDPARPEEKVNPAIEPTYVDVSYGPYERNVMDVWVVDTPKPAPVLISIHGGGFYRGEKSVSNRLLRQCNEAGIAVVTINYRFSDEAIAPAQFYDAARAVQFIRHNAKAWNIDPDRIASSGGSAGAGLSLWLGFHDDLADPDNADPVLRQSTRLTCMAVNNGQTTYDPRHIRDLFPGTDTYLTSPIGKLFGVDLKKLDDLPQEKYDLFIQVSPLHHLTKDDVPALFTYRSAEDAPVIKRSVGIHHPKFGLELKERMDKLNIECQVHADLDGKDELRAKVTMDFLKRHLGASSK